MTTQINHLSKSKFLAFLLSVVAALIHLASAELTLDQFQHDMQVIKPLLPAGEKLARSWQLPPDAQPDTEFKELRGSYKIADLNKDSRKDLLIVTEKPPTRVEDPSGDHIEHSRRQLYIFLADEQGVLRLFTSNGKIIVAADEGGVNGDPFGGVSILEDSVIELSIEGGSGGSHWGYEYRIQFRKDDFYLIAKTVRSSSNSKNKFENTEHNLVTGEVVITSGRAMTADDKTSESKLNDKVTRKQEKTQPLLRLKDMIEE